MRLDLEQRRIVFICRGYPGLGRVSPSVATYYGLLDFGLKRYCFVSYLAGYRYLHEIGLRCYDIGAPEGNFIEPISRSSEMCLDILQQMEPDLVIIDGEPYLPVLLRELGYRIVYLANPHDLFGSDNHFCRVSHLLLSSYTDKTVVSGPFWRQCATGSIPEHVVVVPPLVKIVPPCHSEQKTLPSEVSHPHVVVSLGGGVAKSGPTFTKLTEMLLHTAIEALQDLCDNRVVNQATVILGYGYGLPTGQNLASHPAITVLSQPVELLTLFPVADLIISRAGRNTICELIYYRKKGIIIPLSTDPTRGAEQRSNAEFAQLYPNLKVINTENAGKESLIDATTMLLASGREMFDYEFEVGNDMVCKIVLDMLTQVQSPS